MGNVTKRPVSTTAGGCRATRNGYACTRKQDHGGRHEVHGIDGVILSMWASRRRDGIVSAAGDAHTEAERRWPTRYVRIPCVLGATTYPAENPRADGFVAGAGWQASLKVEVTEDMVNIVQERLYDDLREGDRPVIRAALVAALGAQR